VAWSQVLQVSLAHAIVACPPPKWVRK
jgi:hypothetical protein